MADAWIVPSMGATSFADTAEAVSGPTDAIASLGGAETFAPNGDIFAMASRAKTRPSATSISIPGLIWLTSFTSLRLTGAGEGTLASVVAPSAVSRWMTVLLTGA